MQGHMCLLMAVYSVMSMSIVQTSEEFRFVGTACLPTWTSNFPQISQIHS